MRHFAKYRAILTACCGLACALVQAAEIVPKNAQLSCSYVYEFNFHDPIIRHKAVRQAVKTMLSSSEMSKGLGEPLHFVLPNPLYVQERNLFLGTVEQYLEQVSDIPLPITVRLQFEPSERNKLVADRLVRMLAQSELFRPTLRASPTHFQLAQAEYCANNPAEILHRFHSQSPENRQGYANAEVDAWLVALSQPKIEVSKRDRLIEKIVSALENDIAILPLFQYQRTMHAELNSY